MDNAAIKNEEKKEPFFYVLVPIYKTEKYLDECIRSVLNQSYSNWMLILVDDGSPDRCGEICDEYAAKDSRIKVIHKTNGGLITARRSGIDYVLDHNDGGYILFLDSDDLFEEGAFSLIAKAVKENNPDLLMFDCRTFKDGENLPLVDNSKATLSIIADKRALYKRVFSDTGCNSLWKKCVNLSIVHKEDLSAYYHISLGEDLLQSIPFYRDAKDVCFLDAKLYRYRMCPTSITHSLNYENYRPDFTIRSLIWDFLKKEGVWDDGDFAEYAETCKARLKTEIRTVSTFKTTRANKKEIYGSMLSNEYCRVICSYAKRKDLMVRLFARRRYVSLFALCDYYKLGSWVKGIFRRMKGC